MIKYCTRCGNALPTNWEQGFLNGEIDIYYSSCATQYFWNESPFEQNGIDYNHIAMLTPKMRYQNIKVKWGKDEPYKLCDKCHTELMGIIGGFLKEDKTGLGIRLKTLS